MSENTPSENTPSENDPSENGQPGHPGAGKRKPPFDPLAVTHAASDALNVRRVFGEAYEHNGTWVIPVAKMLGGTGSGFGTGTTGDGEGSGGGGGFGVHVRPIGVFVVDDSGAHWRPALDLNRAVLGAQAVAIVVSLALAWTLRHRRY